MKREYTGNAQVVKKERRNKGRVERPATILEWPRYQQHANNGSEFVGERVETQPMSRDSIQAVKND